MALLDWFRAWKAIAFSALGSSCLAPEEGLLSHGGVFGEESGILVRRALLEFGFDIGDDIRGVLEDTARWSFSGRFAISPWDLGRRRRSGWGLVSGLADRRGTHVAAAIAAAFVHIIASRVSVCCLLVGCGEMSST